MGVIAPVLFINQKLRCFFFNPQITFDQQPKIFQNILFYFCMPGNYLEKFFKPQAGDIKKLEALRTNSEQYPTLFYFLFYATTFKDLDNLNTTKKNLKNLKNLYRTFRAFNLNSPEDTKSIINTAAEFVVFRSFVMTNRTMFIDFFRNSHDHTTVTHHQWFNMVHNKYFNKHTYLNYVAYSIVTTFFQKKHQDPIKFLVFKKSTDF
eukprot:TRINITY_DN1808_c0_g1_i1.p1 TRINITY_DN1808_c0_g1~~TRINITY_DN1808_c0_g1_i1.p1  ORF type:complete len:206 (+),score=-21.42 TRINITY_DN1808_c0_g1_i1:74-691(+)